MSPALRTIAHSLFPVPCSLFLAACSGPAAAPDAGAPSPPDAASGGAADAAPACTQEPPGLVEPLWMAGRAGSPDVLGELGKADAIWIDDNGMLLVGDEHADFEHLVLFDLGADDPAVAADLLPPIAHYGAEPGPSGDGPLEWFTIGGIGGDARTGLVYVAEQGNGRIQVLRPTGRRAGDPPYYELVRTLFRTAPDIDHPADGEFVRMNVPVIDSQGRLYVTDDGLGAIASARRDVQIFTTEGEFLDKFGAGELVEPENIAIDEARGRIYVCDEGPRDLAVFEQGGDHTLIRRFGSFQGIPNGLALDQRGYIYVVDEKAGQVVIFDPDSFEEVWRFGQWAEKVDLTPGTLSSADSILIDVDHDLIAVADQGHDRIQGFRLSEVQRRACLPRNRTVDLALPPRQLAGRPTTLRVELRGPGGAIDRFPLRSTAALSALDLVTGAPIAIEPAELELWGGSGSATVALPGAGDGAVAVTARAGEQAATVAIARVGAPALRELSGALAGAELDWAPADGVIRLSGEVAVPAGATLRIAAGTLVMLAPGARLTVDGGLEARGRADQPIYLFADDPARPWAQIVHPAGQAGARYQELFAAGGGATPMVHHCCGPILYALGGSIELDRVVIADGPGKGLLAIDSDATVAGSQFARLGMGVELRGFRGRVDDTVMVHMHGADDNDGLYLAEAGDYAATGLVVAQVDDDGIDTEFATADLTGVTVIGASDKALSLTGGAPHVRDCLILDAALGIAYKDYRALAPARLSVERCTIAGHSVAGLAVQRSGDVQPDIALSLSEVIVWDVAATFVDDFGATPIAIDHSDLADAMAGEGNLSIDPRFRDPAALDYRLAPGSPAGGAGAAGGPIGWPGP